MFSNLKNIFSKFFNPLGFLACGLSFVLCILLFNALLQRMSTVKMIKTEVYKLQNILNEFGYDIAYDNLSTSNFSFFPLLKIDNFQIYPLTTTDSTHLQVPSLELQSSFLMPNRLSLTLSPQQNITLNGKSYNYTLGQSDFNFEVNSDGNFHYINIKLQDINIKDFAEIKQLSYYGKAVSSQNNLGNRTSFESTLETQNITLNGLLNYPLSQNINLLHIKTSLQGHLLPSDSFARSLNNWLQDGGLFDINSFVINWPPFALVGRGELSFNEELQPRLHLDTSSKAMLDLLDDLDKNKWLDSKGVFVAKVLINSKAYPLKEDDKYLTVTTPIDYRDDRLAIDKITVKNF